MHRTLLTTLPLMVATIMLAGCLSGGGDSGDTTPNTNTGDHQSTPTAQGNDGDQSDIRTQASITLLTSSSLPSVEVVTSASGEHHLAAGQTAELPVNGDQVATLNWSSQLHTCYFNGGEDSIELEPAVSRSINCEQKRVLGAYDPESPPRTFLTDGTAQGTYPLSNTAYLAPVIFLGDGLVLQNTDDTLEHPEFWLSDGTASGTIKADWETGNVEAFSASSGHLYLLLKDALGNWSVQSVASIQSSPSTVRQLPPPGPDESYAGLFALDDRVFVYLSDNEPVISSTYSFTRNTPSDLEGPFSPPEGHIVRTPGNGRADGKLFSWSANNGVVDNPLGQYSNNRPEPDPINLPIANVSNLDWLGAVEGRDVFQITSTTLEGNNCEAIYTLSEGHWSEVRDLCSDHLSPYIFQINLSGRTLAFTARVASGPIFEPDVIVPAVIPDVLADQPALHAVSPDTFQGEIGQVAASEGKIFFFTADVGSGGGASLFPGLYDYAKRTRLYTLSEESLEVRFIAQHDIRYLLFTTYGRHHFPEIRDGILFTFGQEETGLEPWFSDGTQQNTYLLTDSLPGRASGARSECTTECAD